MKAQKGMGIGRHWFGAAVLFIALLALVVILRPAAAASPLVEVEPDTYETATPIAYGQTVEGEIKEPCEDEDVFVFQGKAGDHIQAVVNSTSYLSPSLTISGGINQLIGYWDAKEFGGRYGYARSVYTLPSDGNYYLIVEGYNEEGGDGCDGTYTLELKEAFFLSATQNEVAGGLSFAKSDVVAYDQTNDSWELIYDMSDVGLEDNVAAYFMTSGGGLWFAPVATFTPTPETTSKIMQPIEPQDLAIFLPYEFGPETSGRFNFFEDEYDIGGFDGSDVGLTTNGEAIDAVAVDARRRIVISTKGNCSVPGVPSCADEDLIVFNPTSLGTETVGDWEMFFDGSDIGLESGDIRAVWLDHNNDDIYFALESETAIGELVITPDDVIHCVGGSRGYVTSCEALDIDWSGADHAFPKPIKSVVFGMYNSPIDIGHIDLTNWAVPPGVDLSFAYSGDLGEFTMSQSEGKQFRVPYGDYTIIVKPQADWMLDVICTDPDGETVIDPATRTFTIDVDLGEWIDCDIYHILPVWYVSAPDSGAVDGITFDRSDILAYFPGTDSWEMILDNSETGMTQNLAAFTNLFISPGGQLLNIGRPQTLPFWCGWPAEISITPQDIVRWVGDYEFILDGSDVGLTRSSEAIDAIGISPDGRLLISTTGIARVPGVVAQDEDILAFRAERWSWCEDTVGSWELYFDGSTIPGMAREDVVGLAVDRRGDIYLTLQDTFKVGGVKCGPSCIIVVHPDGTVEKAWDAKASRFPLKLDGIDLPYSGIWKY